MDVNNTNASNTEVQTIDRVFDSFVRASWDEDATQLVFTASKVVPARQIHTLTVLASEGLLLSKGMNRCRPGKVSS